MIVGAEHFADDVVEVGEVEVGEEDVVAALD